MKRTIERACTETVWLRTVGGALILLGVCCLSIGFGVVLGTLLFVTRHL